MKEVGSDDNIDDHSNESHEFDEYREKTLINTVKAEMNER
jgi:hypothetical protein